jgi:hypothetical protein
MGKLGEGLVPSPSLKLAHVDACIENLVTDHLMLQVMRAS